MEHLIKTTDAQYKDEGNGMLEGYASTWIRKPDSYGDVVKEGAFAKSLEERWNGGKGIPVLWAHKGDDLDAYIGKADADEDEKGLHFVMQFDDTPEAQRVRELYRDGRLSKFSFAYDILEDGMVTLDDGFPAHELREVDIFEISCVLVPANDDAGVVSVKNDEPETKAGRRNSAADEAAIREAIEALGRATETLEAVLGEFDDKPAEEPEGGEDEPEDNAAAEDQKASNPEKEALLSYIKGMEVEETK